MCKKKCNSFSFFNPKGGGGRVEVEEDGDGGGNRGGGWDSMVTAAAAQSKLPQLVDRAAMTTLFELLSWQCRGS